jgi:hypothetical protein
MFIFLILNFSTGGFGLFQFLVLVLLLVLEIPAAFIAFTSVFVGKHDRLWHFTGCGV